EAQAGAALVGHVRRVAGGRGAPRRPAVRRDLVLVVVEPGKAVGRAARSGGRRGDRLPAGGKAGHRRRGRCRAIEPHRRLHPPGGQAGTVHRPEAHGGLALVGDRRGRAGGRRRPGRATVRRRLILIVVDAAARRVGRAGGRQRRGRRVQPGRRAAGDRRVGRHGAVDPHRAVRPAGGVARGVDGTEADERLALAGDVDGVAGRRGRPTGAAVGRGLVLGVVEP